MTVRNLYQTPGQAFTCNHCTKAATIISITALAPSEWFALQGFPDASATLHACSPACSAELRIKHKRAK